MKVMNKKSLAIFCAGLFFFAGTVTAQVTLTNPIGYSTFPLLFKAILTGVAGLIGGISTIMIIVSGIMFLISAGDPTKMTKAKATLTYAIIGIVVAGTAEAIVLTIQGWIGA
jgi:hypothetical protein